MLRRLGRDRLLRRAAEISLVVGLLSVASACSGGGAQGPGPTANAGTQPQGQTATQQTVQGATQPGAESTTSSLEAGLLLQEQLARVVRSVGPSVVLIETSEGLGSGIVFDASGNIVTNSHVVGSSTSFTVTLADGKQYQGTLVGSFPADDVAVIHIAGATVQPARLGNSSRLEVADIVLAIGNPLGLQSSVTDGIVSALGRTVNEENGATLPNVIQTSAPINPGNSGGALVDLRGQVIGIPTLGAVDQQLGGSAAGIGFAIPSNMVRDIAAQLIEHGKVVDSHRAYLGVQVAATTSGGVLVASVEAGGPAEQAGIAAGDVITAVDGEPTPSPLELATVLATLAPGATVSVDVVEADGSKMTADVTLGELPG